jgi:hypothetical protein
MIESNKPAGSNRRDPIRCLYGMCIYMNQYNERSNELLNQFMAFYIRGAMANENIKNAKEFNALVNNSHIFCQYHIEFIKMLEMHPEVRFLNFKNIQY